MHPIQLWLADNGFGCIVEREAVGGGCISNTVRLCLDDGQRLFCKQLDRAPDKLFQAEADGLLALKQEQALRVPEVIHVQDSFLLLEDLGQARPTIAYWRDLGNSLALLHAGTKQSFGFSGDNFCGSTPQINTRCDDGHRFFAELRIMRLADIALQRNLLNDTDASALEYIADHLERWIPPRPPALIHGDLWSGNIHCCDDGKPALIDPAAYWG